MAHVDTGKGGGRAANADLNIVPFIDLMSVLVIFLLITAVWTQVTMIQIGSSIYGKKSDDMKQLPKPEVHIPLRLDVRQGGFFLIMGDERKSFPKQGGQYNVPALVKALKDFKMVHLTKEDAVITIEDQLNYETLILGMDALLEAEFGQVSISTAAAL